MKVGKFLSGLRTLLRDDKLPYQWSSEELIDRIFNKVADEFCEDSWLFEETGRNISIQGDNDVSFSSTGNKITCTGGGFLDSNLYHGCVLTITGSTNNNGTFTVKEVESDTVMSVDETLTTEASTDALITLTSSISKLVIAANNPILRVSDRIITPTRARLSTSTATTLSLVKERAIEYMDKYNPGWESSSAGDPTMLLCTGAGLNQWRLWPTPDAANVLYCKVIRKSVREYTSLDTCELEFPSEIIRGLLYGCVVESYETQDSDILDKEGYAVAKDACESFRERYKRKRIQREHNEETSADFPEGLI